MSLTRLLCASACAFAVFLSLQLFRLLNIIGSEADILIRWISAISLILLGVFIGALISQKKIRIRAVIVPFLLFALGFLAAPFVGIAVLMLIENSAFAGGIKPVMFGASIAIYLLLYMGLWFWLKKKGILRFADANDL